MSSMGIKKNNGQLLLCFTCVQCKKHEIVDFRHYPVCKSCDKFNNKDYVKAIDKAKKDKDYLNKLKKSIRYYLDNKTLCDLVCQLRDEEKYNLREIAERVTELGFRAEKAANWTPHMIFWVYKQKARAEKIIAEIEKFEKTRENS